MENFNRVMSPLMLNISQLEASLQNPSVSAQEKQQQQNLYNELKSKQLSLARQVAMAREQARAKDQQQFQLLLQQKQQQAQQVKQSQPQQAQNQSLAQQISQQQLQQHQQLKRTILTILDSPPTLNPDIPSAFHDAAKALYYP